MTDNGLVILTCPTCRLGPHPYNTGEARLFAGLHDRLHHRGRSTAEVTTTTESARA